MARRAPVIGKTDRCRVSFIAGRSFLDIPHGVLGTASHAPTVIGLIRRLENERLKGEF
jgi:hypothetical protein